MYGGRPAGGGGGGGGAQMLWNGCGSGSGGGAAALFEKSCWPRRFCCGQSVDFRCLGGRSFGGAAQDNGRCLDGDGDLFKCHGGTGPIAACALGIDRGRLLARPPRAGMLSRRSLSPSRSKGSSRSCWSARSCWSVSGSSSSSLSASTLTSSSFFYSCSSPASTLTSSSLFSTCTSAKGSGSARNL